MKKILNDPNRYVDDMLDGMCAAYPSAYIRKGEGGRVLVRTGIAGDGKVGIVTGGGSGHLPLFHGYLGTGFVDACAVGNVFAGPRVADCLDAMNNADRGAGVLQLYGNYGGDRMNFEMARELAEFDGKEVTSVRVADDVASASKEEKEKRRGVAGTVYAYKIAGAAAQKGDSLDVVTAAANKAAGACHTIGIALEPCIVPEVKKAAFTIGTGEIEFGMGIHGEPGIWRGPLKTASELANEMLELLVKDADLHKGSRVSVMVNSLGATPLEELFILYKDIAAYLGVKGVSIVQPLIGRFATSMEMAGASVTICNLDAELEQLLAAPATSPFWSVQ